MIVDTVEIGPTRPAPGGGLIVPARIGRSGVQVYRRPDGTTVRANRPAAEVQAADFTGAPITIGHPEGGVSPKTWRERAVGHVRSQAKDLESRGAHAFAVAELQLDAEEAVQDARERKLSECSCAYSCEQIWGAGVTDSGEEYDVTFKGIQPNHIALGGDGFARAGRDAKMLIADGETADNVFELVQDATPRRPGAKCPDCGRDMSAYCADCYGVHKRRGQTPTQDGSGENMVDQKEHDQLVADHAALRIKHDALVQEHEATKGKLAAADGKCATLQTQVDALPNAIADGVQSELAFRSALSGRLPEGYDPKGKSARELKIAAIKHAQPQAVIADSASDDFVQAYFEATAPAAVKHDYREDAAHVQDAAPVSDYQAHMRAESARLFGGK